MEVEAAAPRRQSRRLNQLGEESKGSLIASLTKRRELPTSTRSNSSPARLTRSTAADDQPFQRGRVRLRQDL
ncbi:hypothetical protein ACLB2K_046316 [Fragaria x ananassa]